MVSHLGEVHTLLLVSDASGFSPTFFPHKSTSLVRNVRAGDGHRVYPSGDEDRSREMRYV